MSAPAASPRAAPWIFRHYPLLLGVLALLPLAVYRAEFAKFFWFGDDWYLLDQIARLGFWAWTGRVFAENFVPLFKLLWGGGVYCFHGSYFGMIVALWLTHALTIALFGCLLRREGFSWITTTLSLVVIGLTVGNIETLSWSVQWSAVLANTFFFLAVLAHERPEKPGGAWRHHGWVLAAITASALCFSRGVLTGAVLAFLCLLPAPANTSRSGFGSRLLTAVAYLAPAVLVALVIVLFANGNQEHLLQDNAGKFVRMIQFGAWYFCLNPFHQLLQVGLWGPHTTFVLGLLKVSLIVWGLWRSRGRQRRLFLLLLVFDLGNAALLGLGRYHTGLEATVSSRYQYNALFCTIPFAGFWVECTLARLIPHVRLRALAAAVLALLLVIGLLRGWRGELDAWADWRGAAPRAALLSSTPPPPGYEVPGIPFLPAKRAETLIARYQLH